MLAQHLAPGEYEVRIRFGNGARVRRRVQIPRTERLEVIASPVGNVRVQILDSSGRGVAGWSVSAWPLPPDSTDTESDTEGFYAQTDDTGSALLRGIPVGPSRVEVDAPGWGSQRIDLLPEFANVTEGGEPTVVFRVARSP